MPSTDSTEGVGAPTPLTPFYVTFGTMYRHERHPYWRAASPDGWLLVLAPDEEAARLLLRRTISNRYAFIYTKDRFKRDYHPDGEIGRITSDGKGGIISSHPELKDKFSEQDPEYWGRASDEVVCARIEGRLHENSDPDAIEQLGYETEYVHQRCIHDGVALFDTITDMDYRVLAGELDWSERGQYVCAACDESIL